MRSLWLPLCLVSVAVWAKPPSTSDDPALEYARRAAKLGDRDPKGWLELADFCEEHLLRKEREASLRKVVALDPDHAEARRRLGETRVGKEWRDLEETLARDREENLAKGRVFYGDRWMDPKDAEKIRESDSRLVGWKVGTRVDTAHLRVYSARPLEFTQRIASLLESTFDAYIRLYGKVWKPASPVSPFRVELFADHETFAKTPGAGKANAYSGYYHHGTQTLYLDIASSKAEEIDPTEGLRTAAHEMLHAMDHRVAGLSRCPFWMEEGRAEHFEYSVSGTLLLPGFFSITRTCLPNGHYMDQLGEVGLLEKAYPDAKLAELLDLDKKKVDGDARNRNYALFWAFVHFLFHAEGGRHAEAFKTYLAGCPSRSSPADFEKAVGKLSEMEPAFKRYVETVFLPMVRFPEGKD